MLCICFELFTLYDLLTLDTLNGKKDSKQNLKILPVFVTLDPRRDSPSQLRAYLKGHFLFTD